MRQKSLQLILLVLSGLVGGMISGLIFNPGTLFAQKGHPVEKVIEAQEFKLVDADGNVRAKLGNFGDVSGLEIYGKDGKIKIGIGEFTTDGRGIKIYDNKEQPRASLGVVSEVGPELTFQDINKTPRIVLQTRSSDGLSGLFFKSKDGKPRSKFIAVDNGPAGIVIHQENNGEPRAGLTLGDNGSVALDLSDSNGKLRNSLGVGNDGKPTHQMGDKNGRVIWQAP